MPRWKVLNFSFPETGFLSRPVWECMSRGQFKLLLVSSLWMLRAGIALRLNPRADGLPHATLRACAIIIDNFYNECHHDGISGAIISHGEFKSSRYSDGF